NLGGEDIISSSQLITRAHHGDWYRFGAKKPSMLNLAENDDITGWTYYTPPVYDRNSYTLSSGNWDWPEDLDDNIGNPCPAGWRIPDPEELAAAINIKYGGYNTQVNPPINIITNVPASWATPGVTEFSNLKKSGDYLYFPTAGFRLELGKLGTNRGLIGFFWNSKGANDANAYDINITEYNDSMTGNNYRQRNQGLSVRCVEK
ncbi:MAG: fibrobacter succinogenes major paralogous domain-containing protein, partial [Dysgonamonadaceae bacterium]|nr:fibrobacter succinogenes major paralogous domain-containing protein [Dysgonamonadaceae bacterium]